MLTLLLLLLLLLIMTSLFTHAPVCAHCKTALKSSAFNDLTQPVVRCVQEPRTYSILMCLLLQLCYFK